MGSLSRPATALTSGFPNEAGTLTPLLLVAFHGSTQTWASQQISTIFQLQWRPPFLASTGLLQYYECPVRVRYWVHFAIEIVPTNPSNTKITRFRELPYRAFINSTLFCSFWQHPPPTNFRQAVPVRYSIIKSVNHRTSHIISINQVFARTASQNPV